MRRSRGFTLIELMIVVAVIGILATLAGSYMRASRRNAGVAAAAFDLQMRIEQLQFTALSEQTDQLLVIADVPGNDAAQCGTYLSAGCARLFHLRGPTSSWKLSNFDIASPGAEVAQIVDDDRFGQGIKFHLGAATTATLPVPFNAYAATFKTFDPDLTAACTGTPAARKCVAFRFLANGKVVAEPPDPTSPPASKAGHALALGSDLTGKTGGARQVGLFVATPSGIVRTFAVP